MRRVLCVASMLGALMVSVLAQTPSDSPTFRAGTTLIEFTVVVTGADGKAVTDLKQEDVLIAEGSRPREVAFFHYEGASPAAIRVRSQPLPPGIYTNRPEYAPGPPRNITAILIDSLNTRAEDQVKVLAHILAFISAVPAYLDVWRRLEADPTVEEVIRNFVVRQPLLWTTEPAISVK